MASSAFTAYIIDRFLKQFGQYIGHIDTNAYRYVLELDTCPDDIPYYEIMTYEFNQIKGMIIRGRLDKSLADKCIQNYFENRKVNSAKKSIHMSRLPDIRKLVYNGDTTVVLWGDGTKTVVRCSDNDIYDREKALMMCMLERMFDSKTKLKNFLNEACLYDKYPLPDIDRNAEIAKEISGMSCAEIAKVLGLSESTIRRGRKKLEEQNGKQ